MDFCVVESSEANFPLLVVVGLFVKRYMVLSFEVRKKFANYRVSNARGNLTEVENDSAYVPGSRSRIYMYRSRCHRSFKYTSLAPLASYLRTALRNFIACDGVFFSAQSTVTLD